MARGRRGNFNFLDNYTHFVPCTADLFILLVWFVVGIIAGNLVSTLFLVAAGADITSEFAMLVSYPVMFIPAMIYSSSKSNSNRMRKKGLKVDGGYFGTKGALICALLVIAGTLALSFAGDAVTSILPAMPEWLESMLDNMTKGNFWVNFICISLFAPVFEEWLCRGMVLRGLLGNGVKPVWSIIWSALFFALIHANPWQAIPAFLMGCLFGYVYYKTGSLKLTMLMHFTNNTFALILSHLDAFKDMDSWKDVLAGPSYWVILAASLIVVALVVKAFRDIPAKWETGGLEPVPSVFEEG